MSQEFLVPTVAVLTLLCNHFAFGQTNYDAPQRTITIDGDLSDWDGAGHGVLSHSHTSNAGGDPVNVDIKYAWDADNFYTLVQETTVDDDPVEGVDAGDWVSGPDSTGPAAPWGTDSVGFYDGNRELGIQIQWWVGLSSDDEQRHLAREFFEDDNTTALIMDQSANNVTDGKRSVEFRMAWDDIRFDQSDPFAVADHTRQDVAEGYSFRLDPLLVDGVGNGSEFNGQTYPGGATSPLDVLTVDQSIVVLTGAPMMGNGDFDGNGVYECADVDALVADIAAGNNTAEFDLNSDAVVDGEDLTAWLSEAGEANLGAGRTYLEGDATLDGVVDVSDFNIWNGAKFTATPAWCSGDFTADGNVDVSDFNLWNTNKFTSSDVAAVPEPSCMILIMLGLLGAVGMCRNRR